MINLITGEKGVNSIGGPEISVTVFEKLLANALIHHDYFINAPLNAPINAPLNAPLNNLRTEILNIIRNNKAASYKALQRTGSKKTGHWEVI